MSNAGLINADRSLYRMCRKHTPDSLLYCGHARSLSDVDRSTVANDKSDKLLTRTLLSTVALLVTLTGCASTQEAGDGSDAQTQALTFLQVKAAPDSFERSSGGLRRQSVDSPTTERWHEDRNLTVAARSIDASRIRLDPITRPLHRPPARIPRSRDPPTRDQSHRDRRDLRFRHAAIG